MQYSPPPLFKQGASARAKVVFFSVLAIFLLVVDARMKSLVLVRQALGTVLYPVQMLAVVPRDAALSVSNYFASTVKLEKENAALKRQQIQSADVLQQATQITAENAHLRKLLDAREHVATKSVLSEIIYDARDPFTRKVIVDKGLKHGVALSQPVIDDQGVVGQVTRVFPLTAEVTLLTDKNQAIPVQVVRNGLRSVVYGRGQSSFLDMRITTNADVKAGDVLVTSGIDGVYPAGLQVAKVTQVENKASTTFENVLCTPLAGIDHNKQLLILLVETNQLARPDTEEVKAKKEKLNRKVTRDTGRDSAKEGASLIDQKAVEGAGQAVAPPSEAAASVSTSSAATKDVAPPARAVPPPGANKSVPQGSASQPNVSGHR
ncbi:MAG: rod shape-determining protein MreC [Burkholderiaceae bacterium]|nr:rod shape-determining protein MreC [Burkholderiaceae bacterium]